MSSRIVDRVQVEAIQVPVNTTGAAAGGSVYVNLANYERVQFIIQTGAWAGGTSAVTLSQATDASGTGAKAVAIATKWSKATTGTWTSAAVTSNTFNLSAANTTTVIEVKADDLDTSGGFTYVTCTGASPGSNNDYVAILAVLTEPRYVQNSANGGMIDAKV